MRQEQTVGTGRQTLGPQDMFDNVQDKLQKQECMALKGRNYAPTNHS